MLFSGVSSTSTTEKRITKFDDYDMSKLYNVAWEDMSAFLSKYGILVFNAGAHGRRG